MREIYGKARPVFLEEVVSLLGWFDDHVLIPRVVEEEDIERYRLALRHFEDTLCEEQGSSWHKGVLKDLSGMTELGARASAELKSLLALQREIVPTGCW